MEQKMGHAAAIPMITTLAAHSAVGTHKWERRGLAPIGFIKGMAVAFGRVYCKLKLGDPAAIDIAKADTGNPYVDAVPHLRSLFTAHGMDNSRGGAEVLRNMFVLLFGLGMRETSGEYGEGQDKDGGNTTANTVEAGLFQVSYNSHGSSVLLDKLFQQYRTSTDFIEIFKEGVSASASALKNWGSGTGQEFQKLTKACPAFAVEYAGVVLRHDRQYSGPINRKTIELRRECSELFIAVQNLIDRNGFTGI
jgi:hypothetical protein